MIDNIKKLPNELITKIYDYISYDILMFLTKKNYDEYHYAVLKDIIDIKNKNIHNYVRYIIRCDNYIALNDLLRNLNKLNIKNHKIKYKYKKYANFLDYMIYLCIENNNPSTKCKNVIMEYL
jgi:hypothetical protein